jgi:hypothetical protein
MSVLIEPEEIFFDDYPDFTPHYKPTTMLKLGVFGGIYFNNEPPGDKAWENLKSTIFSDSPFWDELDRISEDKISHPLYQKHRNFFQVRAGKDQAYWEEKGWIHPDDPRGWFEWYIKFFYGRRHEDDERQIKRWKDFITRHWGMLNSLCIKWELKNNPHQPQIVIENPKNLLYDIQRAGLYASPTTCQNLLQWGWDYRIKPKTKK